ncbi:MAG: flagellar biosynthesis protein FlhB [Phycisphaeraceae bacterium]
MAEDNFEKTEPATPRKREQAREQGQVARSTDLTAAFALLAAVVMFFFLGRRVWDSLHVAAHAMLTGAHASNLARLDELEAITHFALRLVAGTLMPVMLTIFAVVLLINVAQVGFMITLEPLTPKFSKLSPLKGVKNLVNARAGMRFVMSMAKVAVILGLAVILIYQELPRIMRLGQLDTAPAFTAASEIVFAVTIQLVILLIVLAILDYLFQRWQHERDLKMSKQEVKEEMKRMEGDPLVKQRRTRVARQIAMQRIAQQVPSADVIVTNPTHYAVALRYDSETMRAPKVIAKGADFLAMRIRQIAATHGIPIVERKPLAQALYAGVEIGQEVPPEHYTAVAEILAYVYRLGERRSA